MWLAGPRLLMATGIVRLQADRFRSNFNGFFQATPEQVQIAAPRSRITIWRNGTVSCQFRRVPDGRDSRNSTNADSRLVVGAAIPVNDLLYFRGVRHAT